MTEPQFLTAAELEELKAVDTCTVSNAIERFDVRLRNEGFFSNETRCQLPNLPPMVGFAATARIRSESPPINHRCYYDRMDWWHYLASLPKPSVMVLQDTDEKPGLGAFVGEIHAAIGQALNCVGCVTNGSVRDLPAVEKMGFQLFAPGLSVSHSYAHIVDFGEPVDVGGLKIHPGDLLHGDRHGLLVIPFEVATRIAGEAATILREERALIDFCASPEFSLHELSNRMTKADAHCGQPWSSRFGKHEHA